MTWMLAISLFLLIAVLWALFISGPARLHEVQLEESYAKIKEQVPDIQGLEENIFDYVTYSGYTNDTIYWFNQKCEPIATRDLATLDYTKAKQVALDEYDIETQTINLTFGYSAPCYEIQGEKAFLLLDYDTFERVYERDDQ